MSRIKIFFRDTYCRALILLKKIGGFRLYAFLLFLAMTLAFNAQIWRMGYYYDDWEGVLLQKQMFSPSQIWEYFLIDRPFSALIHWAFNPLLGAAPLGWRILGQVLNWAALLLLVKTLLKIWPKRVMEIGWIGLLLALYPGITRQFVVRTSIPHYTSMLLFTLSLLLMVKAVTETRRRTLFTVLSIALAVLQMLIIEYFAGLELVRLLLLFYLVRQDCSSAAKAARKTVLMWLPYASAFVFFVLFRFAILPVLQVQGMVVKNEPKVLTQILAHPASAILNFAEVITRDVVYAVLYVWSQVIVPEEIDFQSRATMVSWVIGILVAILCAVGMALWHQKNAEQKGITDKEPFPFLVFLICAAALFLGGLPIWIIGRQATQGMWRSRYLFGPVMGAIPLVVLFVAWLTGQRKHAQNIFLAALLVGSFSMQFRTANKYALDYAYQRDYYWQLKWRAPGLKPGVFILSPYTPFVYNANYEIAFAINILYAPGNPQANLRYWWYDGPDSLFDYDLNQYPTQKEVDRTFRSLSFHSNMQLALPVIYRPARGCLQVVNQVYQSQPALIPVEKQLYSVQNTGLISEDGPSVASDIFGQEPKHDWCYYFQKADLARELKQWDRAAALWDEAAARGLKPNNPPEYLPFIESSLHLGKWQQAVQITQAANTGKDMEPFLCGTWSRVVKEIPESAEKTARWDSLKTQLGCLNSSK